MVHAAGRPHNRKLNNPAKLAGQLRYAVLPAEGIRTAYNLDQFFGNSRLARSVEG